MLRAAVGVFNKELVLFLHGASRKWCAYVQQRTSIQRRFHIICTLFHTRCSHTVSHDNYVFHSLPLLWMRWRGKNEPSVCHLRQYITVIILRRSLKNVSFVIKDCIMCMQRADVQQCCLVVRIQPVYWRQLLSSGPLAVEFHVCLWRGLVKGLLRVCTCFYRTSTNTSMLLFLCLCLSLVCLSVISVSLSVSLSLSVWLLVWRKVNLQIF